ncbi:MAG TPA: hypothetical protein VII91_05015 [Bauldia sp.]
MSFASTIRKSAIAIAALAAMTASAYADTGSVHLKVVKAGFGIGGSGGDGSLAFHGSNYRLSIGGLSAGFIIGASETRFSGAVSHIRSPSDIAGVYAAVGAGAAAGNAGAGVITLTNEKGAILTLTASRVVGLIVNVDLSGMVVSLR